ncbi:hypothetical protein [Nonomuraea candida]|uniref:hypothetical protein n=1 Tax=Nonomuraea candida TaxID=359159 RepID=UPI0005BAC74A|nr:hypothetical protein [Nonomuraea candida]
MYEADGTVTLNGVDVTRRDEAAEDVEQVATATEQAAPGAPGRPARRVALHLGPARRRPAWPRPARTTPAARRLTLRHGRRRSALTR